VNGSKEPWVIGVGQPASIKLNLFGRIILDVFGELPYLVGSAARGKHWRDVDVRLMLSREDFQRWCGDARHPHELNPRWAGLCLAFATLGQQMTGLPIDFQIQTIPQANAMFPKGPRWPLGMRPTYPPDPEPNDNLEVAE
jgi:hypothetical protein